MDSREKGNSTVNERTVRPVAKLDTENEMEDTASLPGIIAELATLPSSAIITEEGVAHLFDRHVVSVKRAVQRGELPQPCPLFGAKIWTAGVLIRHIEKRLEHAAKDADRTAERIAGLSPRLSDHPKIK